MKFKDTDVTTHPSVDNSDPGFAIRGMKLRWISSAVEARRAGRFWQPLKASMLPEKALAKLRESNPSWFTTGDTIKKRGDLTLAFAPFEVVEARRKELRANQQANEAVFRPGSHALAGGVRTEKDNHSILERVEPSEQFS